MFTVPPGDTVGVIAVMRTVLVAALAPPEAEAASMSAINQRPRLTLAGM
jgi:hypothetical protein